VLAGLNGGSFESQKGVFCDRAAPSAVVSANILLKKPNIIKRISELRARDTAILERAIAQRASYFQLAVTEREQRLQSVQERFDALRQARQAFADGDYEAAMRTGVVCRRVRWIGGKDGREVVEYEINSALIEGLNSVEKRAAIETGQEQENVNLTGQISAKSIALSKVMTIEELEALERKMLAAMEAEKAGKALEAPK
jgi:hypothetical protein